MEAPQEPAADVAGYGAVVPMSKKKEWLGWHFLADDGKVAHTGQQHSGTLVVAGQTLALDGGKIEPCMFGLHASKKPLEALQYATGSIIARVRLSGEIVEHDDKAAARSRTALWVMDASRALHICSVYYAELALDRVAAGGAIVDPRSRAALEVKLRWVNGQASDSDLAAAGAAARAAAWAAAGAAGDAAWDAAGDAAWDAARAAAGDAAGAAAGAAAGDAAWDAERKLQNEMLEAALWAQYEAGIGVRK